MPNPFKKLFPQLFSKPQPTSPAAVQEIGAAFTPDKGDYFQTLEYPVFDAQGQLVGKSWMEASRPEKTQPWALWLKAVANRHDALLNQEVRVLSTNAKIEATDFKTCFDQMMTYEIAQRSVGLAPLDTKTKMKLGGDYFRQFAWREGLTISRSGRLFPVDSQTPSNVNYSFDEDELQERQAFMERLRAESFVPVPLRLPSINWEKAYPQNKEKLNARLNVLRAEINDDFELMQQIVSNETPGVLYAHMIDGFSICRFHDEPERHYALAIAALDRPDVEVIDLMLQAGFRFNVRGQDSTPVRHAIRNRRYSHLHAMLSADGKTLSNFAAPDGASPMIDAVREEDLQTIRMLDREEVDYTYADPQGWQFVHHAFDEGFLPPLYLWMGAQLPLDAPIAQGPYTGVSLAKRAGRQDLIAFAQRHGASIDAPDMPELDETAAPDETGTTVGVNESLTQTVQALARQENFLEARQTFMNLLRTMVANKNMDGVVQALLVLGELRQENETAAIGVARLLEPLVDAPFEQHHSFLFHLLNNGARNADIERIARAYVQAGGALDRLDANRQSLWEACWKNPKPMEGLNRRDLLPLWPELGLTPTTRLEDGSLQLTRTANATAFDVDFLKTLAAMTSQPNETDDRGNNVLHAFQLNANDQAIRSSNYELICRLFPGLDLDRQNEEGYSNFGLGIRLDRPQTLKLMFKIHAADLTQVTDSGWSYLDIAFTDACKLATLNGFPKTNAIVKISDASREAVMQELEQNYVPETQESYDSVLNRLRPDGKTLLSAMQEENAPPRLIERLTRLLQKKSSVQPT